MCEQLTMTAYVFEVESSRTPVAPWPADVEFTRESLGPRARPSGVGSSVTNSRGARCTARLPSAIQYSHRPQSHGSVRASSDVSVTGDDDVAATATRRAETSDRPRGVRTSTRPGHGVLRACRGASLSLSVHATSDVSSHPSGVQTVTGERDHPNGRVRAVSPRSPPRSHAVPGRYPAVRVRR
jgi:hypothetical protein